MDRKYLGVCVISFPVSKAFITPLSNIQKILLNFFSYIYVIVGCTENIMAETNSIRIKTYEIQYKQTTNILARILQYLLLEIRVSLVLAKIVKKVDLCIFFMEGTLLPVLTTKLLKKKSIQVFPSLIMKETDKFHRSILLMIYIKLLNIAYFLSDRIILYSPNLIKEWSLKKYRDKILIAHEHFLNFDKFKIKKAFNERNNLVGYIGRLSEEKGVLNFLEAILRVSKEKKGDISFLIGGDGQLRGKVEEYLSRENLGDKVHFVGWIPHDELPDYLNELKLLVLPSYTEGLPNIMLEAMACGTPVLATSVGGIPDVIKDGETGFLLKSNDPKHIANKIIELLNKPKLLEKISKNAYEYVRENFSYEKTLQAWRKIINELEAQK